MLLLLSCQNEPIPLDQPVILCLGRKEVHMPFLSMSRFCWLMLLSYNWVNVHKCPSVPTKKDQVPTWEWSLISLLSFQPCKISSSFPSRGEFWQKFSTVTKSTFSSLFCCAIRFEAFCPENNTLQLLYAPALHCAFPDPSDNRPPF